MSNFRYHICLLLCGLVLFGCTKKADQTSVAPLQVNVLTVSSQSVVPTHTYVAKIAESNTIPLSVQSPGKVTEVLCRASEKVKEGQLLLRLDKTQAQNAYNSAQAAVKEAEDAYQRVSQVYEQGGVTAQKMVEIESKRAQAQSLLDMATKALQDCELRAPKGGVIGRCDIQVGQVVVPGVTLITILDVAGYNAVFAVPETEIASVVIGDNANVDIPAINATNISARVTEKNMVANIVTHTYEVKASINGNTTSLLPGMVAKIRLRAHEQSGFVIPTSCVTLQPSGTMVWLAKDSVAERRAITVGAYTEGGVLVTEGLQLGDKVITDGAHKLYQGAAISYQ